MREFRINPWLIARLEGNTTVLYVGGKPFNQCMQLSLHIPRRDFNRTKDLDQVDWTGDAHAALSKGRSWQPEGKHVRVEPETEFWGHCSYLQAWYEHGYDTKLLNSRVAFPLLKSLAKAGDPEARRAFIKELLEQLRGSYPLVTEFLLRYVVTITEDEDLFQDESTKRDIYELVLALLDEAEKPEAGEQARRMAIPSMRVLRDLAEAGFKAAGKMVREKTRAYLRSGTRHVTIFLVMEKFFDLLDEREIGNFPQHVQWAIERANLGKTNLWGLDKSAPVTFIELLFEYAKQEQDDEYLRQIAGNPKATHAIMRELLEIDEQRDHHFISDNLSSNENSPPDVLGQLGKMQDREIIIFSVARNWNTPKETLAMMAQCEMPKVKEMVALNRNTPPEVVASLANDPDHGVRHYVSRRKTLPISLLERLANDTHHYVRAGVAKNPSTPPRIMETLVNDDHWLVRYELALNKSTPGDILTRLATDENYKVQRVVALNVHTPLATLRKLEQDPNECVREAARRGFEKRQNT